jgi:hypothetical protein
MANHDNQNQQNQNQQNQAQQGGAQGLGQDANQNQQDRGQNQGIGLGDSQEQDMDRAPDQMMNDKRAQQGQQENALRDEHSSEPSLNRQHGGDLSRIGVERNRNAGGMDGKQNR